MEKRELEVKKRVKEKFSIEFEELSEKKKKKLLNVELILGDYKDKQVKLLNELEKLKLNKVKISKLLNVSRKTLYNDAVLNGYIEMYLEEEKERLNKKESENLGMKTKYIELKVEYEKLLCNIIDMNLIREENEYLKRSIESLTRQNEELRVLLYNDDKVIGFTEKRGKK